MFLALVFYLLTIPARSDRVNIKILIHKYINIPKQLACVASSVFLHYSYTAAYSWMAINAHYIFRASTSGELGGRVLTYYSYIGWGIVHTHTHAHTYTYRHTGNIRNDNVHN
jgi:hypothetical protein